MPKYPSFFGQSRVTSVTLVAPFLNNQPADGDRRFENPLLFRDTMLKRIKSGSLEHKELTKVS